MAGPTDLERSILHTACWFAVHHYPVTSFELWKWLWFPCSPASLGEVRRTLSTSAWLKERLETTDGFYALRTSSPSLGGGDSGSEGVQQLVHQRLEREGDARRKFRRLRRAAWFLSAVPTVRGVAAANTLAWWHTRPESDIDLLVLAEPGTVWLTRLLCVAPFALVGARPGRASVDPFCFSFFLDAVDTNIKKLALFGGDPYLAYWSRALVPVTGDWTLYTAANTWAGEMLPHARPRAAHPRLTVPSLPSAFTTFFRWLEPYARLFQEIRLPAIMKERANKDTSVVLSARMLKFHEVDRREEFRDRFQELVTAYE